MTADEVRALRQDRAAAEADRERLTRERAALQTVFDEALSRSGPRGPWGFDPAYVRRCRQQLAALDDARRDADDRVTALTAKLPDATQRAEAARGAMTLSDAVTAHLAAFDRAVASYCTALDAAEHAAREVHAARLATRAAISSLATQVAIADAADTIAVPPMPEIDRTVANVALLQAIVVRDVGDPEDVVVRDLHAAREALAQTRLTSSAE